MVKIINEEVNKRRDRILALLRMNQWVTARYLQHATGALDSAVKRDLKYWESKGYVEVALALETTEKKCKDGSTTPTANRISLARLTEKGKKERSCESRCAPRLKGAMHLGSRSCKCQD